MALKQLFNNQETVTRQLPNNGGSYEAPAAPQYTPLGGVGTVADGYTFKGGTDWLKTTPQQPQQQFQTPQQPVAPQTDLYAKYRDPKTGDIMSPEEYSVYLGSKVPQTGNGSIPQYAGDAMTNPDESAQGLTERARNMNNSRNDIATGTTDPYKVGAQSGIAYSPQELKAIESAYAGVYDPALNDVFARLKTREEEAKREQDREDKIFATNESIRQWKATTGTNSTKSSGPGSNEKVEDRFTQTQINKGMVEAGMNQEQFLKLDSELANYYINPPKVWNGETEENELASLAIRDVLDSYSSGVMTKEDAMAAIEGMGLSPEVTAHFLMQIPGITPEEAKEAWYKKAWNWVDDKVEIFD